MAQKLVKNPASLPKGMTRKRADAKAVEASDRNLCYCGGHQSGKGEQLGRADTKKFLPGDTVDDGNAAQPVSDPPLAPAIPLAATFA